MKHPTARIVARAISVAIVSVLFTAAPASFAQSTAEKRVLTLKEAERLLQNQSRDIRLARLALLGASADVMRADTRPNPTLSWNAQNVSTADGVGPGGFFDKRIDQVLRLDQPLERGGKRALRVEAARAAENGARSDLQDQERQSLFGLRGAYYDLMLAEQRLKVFEDTNASYAATLAAGQRRLTAGDLAKSDFARVQVDALRAQADLMQARADLVRAQTSLASLLAIEPDAPKLATDSAWPDEDDRCGATAAAPVEARPDVASALQAERAAQANLELAQSQRTRDVTVSAQVERFPGPLGTGNTIGIGVSIPLFTGNDYRGDIARAAADRDTAHEHAEKVRASAITDRDQARSDLDSAHARAVNYRMQLLPAAQDATKAAEFAFERGALAVMELMDAKRTLLSIQLDALQSSADAAKASAACTAAFAGSVIAE